MDEDIEQRPDQENSEPSLYSKPADQKKLAMLEALLSGGTPDIASLSSQLEPVGVDDDVSFYNFCAQLAATMPLADDAFQARLKAQLSSKFAPASEVPPIADSASPSNMEYPAQSEIASKATTSVPGRDWAAPDKPVAASARGRRARRSTSTTVHRQHGRAFGLATGIVGVLLLVVLFGGMAVMLKLRQETNKAGVTPTVLTEKTVVPSESSRLLPGIAPLQTLETTGVQDMAWSYDGRLLATKFGSNVEIWDGETGRLLSTLTVYNVTELDWAPDSYLLAVGESSNNIRVFDGGTGSELHPAPLNSALENNWQAAWSSDGKTLASAFVPTPVGTPPTPLPPGDRPYFNLSGTPVPGVNDAHIRVWDAESGNTVRALIMSPTQPQYSYPRRIAKLIWSPEGRYLAGLLEDGAIGVWDVSSATDEEPKFMTDSFGTVHTTYHESTPRDLQWSADGHSLAILGVNVVMLWDASTGTQTGMLPDSVPPPILPPSPIPTVADPAHPAPTYVPPPVPTDALGNTITPAPTVLYPTLTASPTYVYRDEDYGIVAGLAWSPDGHALATFDGNNIRIWDPSTKTQTRRLISDGTIRKLAWSSDGGVLFSLQGEPESQLPPESFTNPASFLDGTIKLWDTATGNELRSITQAGLSDFVLSPDGKSLAVRVNYAATIWSTSALPEAASAVPTRTAIIQQLPEGVTATAQPVCGSWSVADAPEPDTKGELRGVAGTNPSDVWAVGLLGQAHEYGVPVTGGIAGSWALHWDGSRWQTTSTPAQGDGDNVLNSVAEILGKASGVADVWAVGYYSNTTGLKHALILHWDGSSWSNVPMPDLSNSEGKGSMLNSVSGSAADDVWAVGSFDDAFTLTLHWDGKSWKQVSSPNPGIDLNTLTTVSAEPGRVWAAGQYVGHYQSAGMPQGVPFVLRWGANQWKPVPIEFFGTYIKALGMAADGEGWALGGYAGEGGGASSFSRWDGTTWKSVTATQLGNIDSNGYSDVPLSAFNAITVISPSNAWLAGSFSQTGLNNSGDWYKYTLVEHWDGYTWSVVPSPNIGIRGNDLSSIVSVSPGELWAVGHTGPGDGPYQPLILHFSGPWCSPPAATPTSIVEVYAPSSSATSMSEVTPKATETSSKAEPTPSIPQAGDCEPGWQVISAGNTDYLDGVSTVLNKATGIAEAWSAGYSTHVPNVPARTVIKHWGGSRWTQVPSPNVGPNDNMLYGIAALPDGQAWAVGSYYEEAGKSKALLLYWDGSIWQVLSGATTGDGASHLSSVIALASDNVWIVGSAAERTLAEHWDGNSWQLVESPNVGELTNALSSITAVSKDDMWAVGCYSYAVKGSEGTGSKTLILHWHDARWQVVQSPNIDTYGTCLAGVAAFSANDVWAVGSTDTGEGGNPVSMHWDGTSWSMVLTPTTVAHNGTGLTDVATLSGKELWAVGGAQEGPYVSRWDGTGWSQVEIPDKDTEGLLLQGSLASVAVISPTEAWAVGGTPANGYSSEDMSTSFIMHYGSSPCGSATP